MSVDVETRRTRSSADGKRAGFNLVSARKSPVTAAVLIAFNKPYGVLSQFTQEPGSNWRTLAGFGLPSNVYPLGRLDADSEGLLLLTDEARLNARLLDPEQAHPRKYWAQVERIPSPAALSGLVNGVQLGNVRTRPARVELIVPTPPVPAREPPIRFRKNVPDCWISLTLVEGKNRQVRRMTAAVGHPTLRLLRVQIGDFPLADLAAGKWRDLTVEERAAVFRCPAVTKT